MDSNQIILLGATVLALIVLWYLFNMLGSLGFSFSALMGAGLGFGVIIGGLFLYLYILGASRSK